MRLKIGDNVKVISGSDKGKFGKITSIDKPVVTVEGINIKTKQTLWFILIQNRINENILISLSTIFFYCFKYTGIKPEVPFNKDCG